MGAVPSSGEISESRNPMYECNDCGEHFFEEE